jgi:hypothetical protein
VRVLELAPDELQLSLNVLGSDLAALVPSYAGLSLTVVVEEQPVTLGAMVQGTPTALTSTAVPSPEAVPSPTAGPSPAKGGASATTVLSSLAFLLAPSTEGRTGAQLVFYAREPGALAALALNLSEVQGVARRDVEVDRHLSPPARSGIAGVEELSLVNRAVGVLVGRGRTVTDARRHLRLTAQESDLQEFQVAAYLVSTTE